MGTTRLLASARRRHRASLLDVVRDLRQLREDAGISQARLAAAAGVDRSYVSLLENGQRQPTLETLHALAAVLGCDLAVRLYPNSGPAIRDRFQARIVEALLRILDPRWQPRLEVPVQRPVRGVIDVVLHDTATGTLVATEVHSELRRVEQQLRWAHQKSDGLREPPVSDGSLPGNEGRAVSRLLILRSTATTRALTRELSATFAAEYPADPTAALAALTTPAAPWPGPALLFARVHGSRASVFAPRRAGR